MNIWRVLGLEPTRDVAAIRRAYAQAARQFHPEEQPEEFQRVHTAYEKALDYARSAPRTTPHPAVSESGAKPEKKHSKLSNKTSSKKGNTAPSMTTPPPGPSRRQPEAGGPWRRPRTEARIVPLDRGRSSAPEPDWLREETEEGQADLFRRAPAMGAFRELWQQEKKRNDKKAWREFFSTPVFLTVQREGGFTAALCDFVEQEVKNGRQLPQRFLSELAIAYGIRYRSKDPYYLSFAAFPGIESIRDILLMGHPLDRLSHEEDKIWAACWRDYFELLAMAKSGGFENPDRTARWKELFDRYRREKITEKPETTRRGENEVEERHPYGLRLLAYFVGNHPLPPEAVQYLYDTLKLETIGTSSARRFYKPLIDAVTPILPDQTVIKEEREAMRQLYASVADFLRLYDHAAYFTNARVLRSYDQRPTQGALRDARAIIASPQFQRLALTRELKESTMMKRIMDSGTCLPALLAEEYQKHQGDPVADALREWALSSVLRQEHDPEFFFDRPYTYPNTCPDRLSLENREFWWYYLSTAFPAALSTAKETPVSRLIREHCHPSWGWRREFTGFDESLRRIPAPRTIGFGIGEKEVRVEFHYFYQKFLAEEKEVEELFPWEELSALEDDLHFWLALPLAIAGETPRPDIRREIYRHLAALPIDDSIRSDVADCLVNHVTTPKKPFTGLARGRLEDGERLYGYEVRQDRTAEAFRLTGILRRDSMRWERPFPNERLAREEAEKYINGRLESPMTLVNRIAVKGRTPQEKAALLVACLGEGIYTEEDRQADGMIKLSATEDFLGWGVEHHGNFTSVIYRAYRHPAYRAAVRFGTQEAERFRLMLTLDIWPFGSPKAKEGAGVLLTRLGAMGTGCYLIGEVGFGDDTYTLVSSSSKHRLYALRQGSEKTFSGGDLAELLAGMLYPSEWNAVEQVESWKEN